MAPLAMPAQLDPARFILALTPGTYSEIVANNLGATPIEQDPILGKADDATLLIANADAAIPSTTDALASIANNRAAIVSKPGTQMVAQLAGAAATVGQKLTSYKSIATPPADPVTPPTPTPGAPPTSAPSNVTILGNANPATPVPPWPGDNPGFIVGTNGQCGTGTVLLQFAASDFTGNGRDFSITALALYTPSTSAVYVQLLDINTGMDPNLPFFATLWVDPCNGTQQIVQLAAQIDGGSKWWFRQITINE